MSNLEETKSNSTEYFGELTEETLADDELESTPKPDENVANSSKPQSNICYYLCLERDATTAESWNKYNRCMRNTYHVAIFISCLAAIILALVILYLFLNWIGPMI